MKDRILATLVLWTLILGLPYLLGDAGAFLLLAVFGTGTFVEFSWLLRRSGRSIDRGFSILAFVVLLLAMIFFPPWVLPPFALLCLGFVLMAIACLLRSNSGEITAYTLGTTGAVFFLLFPFGSGVLIVHESGVALLVWIIAVTKFGDVGALLTGMWLGKNKLSPILSPNKTWEGLAGGVTAAVVISVLYVIFLGEWLPGSLGPGGAAWMAVFIALAGVGGDLLESAFKREANVKDSGVAIPGIGGFFDLSDSLLLALPVGYALIWIFL
jgi:phosphatidate cytidylyltransferase